MEHLYQISHEELLLLSGLLRLAPPLALGPRPTAGYSQAALHVALSAAAGSLVARGFLSPPAGRGEPPVPAPGIAGALRLLAAAEGSLVLAVSQGGQHQAGQVGVRAGGEALLLSHAPSGAYRLCAAHGHAAVIDHVLATIPLAHAGPADGISLTPAALFAALDAAPAGPEAVIASLRTAGQAAASAAAFARRLGHAPARHALVAIRGGDSMAQRGALTVVGAGAAWLADDESCADQLALRPIGPAGLRAHIADLVAWITA
jgi:hypothetical protein